MRFIHMHPGSDRSELIERCAAARVRAVI